jgi:hypothetical protein
MSPRAQLKTGIWVDALIRRAQGGGAFACVMPRGDRDAGSVLVVVSARDALHLYTPERDMEGDRVWRGQALDAVTLARTVAARLDFDPDLTVVEIEDRDGRHFIEEPVLKAPDQKGPDLRELASELPKPSSAQADAVAAAAALFRGQ